MAQRVQSGRRGRGGSTDSKEDRATALPEEETQAPGPLWASFHMTLDLVLRTLCNTPFCIPPSQRETKGPKGTEEVFEPNPAYCPSFRDPCHPV